MKKKASVSHDEVMIKKLRQRPAFAAQYIKVAMEDANRPDVLLIALRHVAEARGGLPKVAKAAGIERESLYRALSPHGNPRFSTLTGVMKAVGLKLTVEPSRAKMRSAGKKDALLTPRKASAADILKDLACGVSHATDEKVVQTTPFRRDSKRSAFTPPR